MYRTIVVGTDCSATADIAVDRAADMARAMGARLHLVSAFSEPVGVVLAASAAAGTVAPDWSEAAIAERDARIEALGARLRLDGLEVTTAVDNGDAAATLIAEAARVDADVIVVGDKGLKGIRGLLGSVPNRLTHKAPVDVLVVHTTS